MLNFWTEITDLEADETFQGFSHENGRLKVQQDGSYYVYAQVFFQTHNTTAFHNRVVLTVNGADFGLMQTGLGGQADYGTLYTGGVTHLQQGDYISLVTTYDSYVWVSGSHTFLGAYKIIEQGFSCEYWEIKQCERQNLHDLCNAVCSKEMNKAEDIKRPIVMLY